MAAPVYDSVRFPDQISPGAVGGPSFNTTVIVGGGGQEQRLAHWSQPRHKWDVSQALRTPAMADELIAFFIARQGRLRAFRFKDWQDYRATKCQTADIDGYHYQLQKTYVSGGVTYARTIYAPVDGTLTLWNGDAQQWADAVDYTTGIVTFGGGFAPQATFEFDVVVRFDVDELRFTQEDVLVRSWNEIPIVEVR